jgi:hypothetical protein
VLSILRSPPAAMSAVLAYGLLMFVCTGIVAVVQRLRARR